MTALEFLHFKFPLWSVQDRLEFNTVCLREENLTETMKEFAQEFAKFIFTKDNPNKIRDWDFYFKQFETESIQSN